MRFTGSGLTARGLMRATNEDGLGLFLDDGAVVVCDGMGGNAAGSYVPQVVVGGFRALVRGWNRTVAEGDDATACVQITAGVDALNGALRASMAALGPVGTGAGGVAGLLWLRGDRVVWAHVGDTRLYHLRAGKLTQVWTEHSLLRAYGQGAPLSPEIQQQLETYARVVTQAFGPSSTLQPDVGVLSVVPGDGLLLVSDGIWRMLDDTQLAALITANPTPDDAVAALFDALHGTAWDDNATAVVLRATAGDAPPSPTPPAPTPQPPQRTRGRWLRPARSRHDEATAIASTSTVPGEVWERLCVQGLLPLDWVDHPGRRFCNVWMPGQALRATPSDALAAALGADGEVVVQVDQWARALRQRLRPWGFAGRDVVVWSTLSASSPTQSPYDTLSSWLSAMVDGADIADIDRTTRNGVHRAGWGPWVNLVLAGAQDWDRGDRPVPRWNRAVPGHPYADLPSPWETLWEIAARGYVVREVAREGIVLGVP